MVGKLQFVDPREMWKHEALHFTKWLFDNCDVLNEQVGLSLSPIEKEKSVGPFNVDIMAEDASGRAVIIENQLEKTDHDHLGKVLTYLSNLGAKVAIWISTDPRPEHVAAVDFLNEVVPRDTEFYLLKIQAIKIGLSEPAPLFTIVAGPSEERTAGGEVKKEFAERDERRYEFFNRLLALCSQKTTLFNGISPVGYQNWVNSGAGKSGIMWTFVAMKKSTRVEFFFCSPSGDVNKKRFETLISFKESIEKDFAEPLIWDFKESRKQQYIKSQCPFGGLDDEGRWSEIHHDMVNRLVRLEKALRPHIKNLT